MPSHMMEPHGLSPSSYFSEDTCFRDGTQVEQRKRNSLQNYHGLKADGVLRRARLSSSLLDNQLSLGSPMRKCLEHPDSYLNQDQHVKIENPAVGVDRASALSLPRDLDHKLGVRSAFRTDSSPYSVEGERINIMNGQFENGLFSSSLSELISRKLRFPMNGSPHGHSVGAAISNYKEEEPIESLEELEAHTIGNLLPDDDDLLAGVTDGLNFVGQHNARDDIEDLDLFSSVGGMDLGEDVSPPRQRNSGFSENSTMQLRCHSASTGGEHPFGEYPSRTLFVRNINSSIEDSELRVLFEQCGDIRTLYTSCKHRGFVMVSYYDIRAARNAMKALQNKPVRQRNLDIHFSIPKDNPYEKDVSQGSLVVFNLDSSVSIDDLRQIFGVYGEIKEIRDAQHGSQHKVIEFYDTRAAEAALHALNRIDIGGKQLKVESTCPGGTRWLMQSSCPESEQDGSSLYLQRNSHSDLTTAFAGAHLHGGNALSMDAGSSLGTKSASGAVTSSYFNNGLDRGISSNIPNSLPSLVSLEAMGNRSSVVESGVSPRQIKFQFRGTPSLLPHSVPEYHDVLSNRVSSNNLSGMSSTINIGSLEANEIRKYSTVGSDGHSVGLNGGVGPSGYGSCPHPGNQYMWNNSHQPQHQGMMWPNSPSFVSGVSTTRPQQLHAIPRGPSHLLSTLLPIASHHIGSAPSINHTLWDGRRPYAGESPDTSVFHPSSLGSMRITGNSPHPSEFVPHNIFPRSGSSIDLPLSSKNIGLHSQHARGLIFPGRDQMIPMINSFDSPNERTRSRRNEGSSSQTDNKRQFELDIDRIARGDDKRTTLMLKNIPNKYTSKMLLAAIDEQHRGTYDFIYLPIDFKNKCNVGYAFINMTDPSLIIPFYQAFNGKKWEKFNSEKVALLAYARIQGKAALVAHFQNSSLMNEDKRCRPILFHTDGPNAGDQVPFPMGVNIRPRNSKSRVSTSEETYQEDQSIPTTGEEFLDGESSSGCVKESN